MKCPACNIDLVMSERSGIEIDYCPTCRGVWLDRGELDKIIERSAPADFSQSSKSDYSRDRGTSRDHDRDDDYQKNRKHKRGGLLGDIFDF